MIPYSKGIDAMKNDGNRVYIRIFVKQLLELMEELDIYNASEWY